MSLPKLRLIHNMARSGSTLICKCLGCMEGVTLLSELHPRAWSLFNPLQQAAEWFGLVQQCDIVELQRQNANYADVIAFIEGRAAERGKALVLRDWGHLDFTGHPWLKEPSYQPALYTELAGRFEIIRICTTREPIAQWQSLSRLGIMREPLRTGVFGVEAFLRGYRRYADLCLETGFLRYEDLVAEPTASMTKMCARLELGFDASFVEKWHRYDTISGDVKNPRVSNVIRTPKAAPVPPDLRDRFLSNRDYREICEMLGYVAAPYAVTSAPVVQGTLP